MQKADPMLKAYQNRQGKLVATEMLEQALWIDLLAPTPDEVAQLASLGFDLPSQADMDEIELSNRLYHDGDVHVMTIMVPGQSADGRRVSAPLSFMLTPARLVTVRFHSPRPFETFAAKADHTTAGCDSAATVFLGLTEEIIARLADHLEEVGRGLDAVTGAIYGPEDAGRSPDMLQLGLQKLGREGEFLSKLRLALLTLGRAIGYAQPLPMMRGHGKLATSLLRDLQSLEVHTDFLAQRLSQASDATLGMIDLAQNATVRIISVVSALFLPPTLIASIYGMNFKNMPELEQSWGYPAAIGVMLASAIGTWAYFKWRKWL
ncbi:magnesium transporter CorA family protein [Gemmobacter serpentinus]|uniref:magnesium transporter CorA family protein n=1 Tax=Gemmobacter serpentinus TaxID=2652247 RepID=UPI001CF6FF3B|nr:magnesium transporter CorA family protein [Gemmobacter serpentinus]